ncbi:MAG: hypothetical protein IT337_15005 [Thermomicrobiales bacterium]|nr:hypothetical protein [Thermomicrobiales bacterium]
MMRWQPTEATESTDDTQPREQDLVGMVFDAVTGFDTRSLVFAATVALIVLTLVLGFATQDAAAGGRWCPHC